MMLTICAAVMQTVLLVSANDPAETYSEAHRQTCETGKPMIVMVSTDWCGPCQAMKKTVLPRLRERGLFKKVAFAQVNADRESELAQQITGGGPVPQLVMYRKTNHGWQRRKLIGAQSEEKVEQFIKEELALASNENGENKTVSEEESTPTESAPATIIAVHHTKS